MSAVTATAVVIPAPRPSIDGAMVDVLPELHVPEAQQWLSSSTGRIAPEGYSWMQGVHWVAGSGMYEPRRYRSHGPRNFGPTTVWIAQLLAELSPCRPGIEYLMRRTGLSGRAVEYHLQMLRETGLLAWELRGTRVSGERAQASVYARMLPPAFDATLGIRTMLRDESAPTYTRAVTGIAETGRELMARLGKMASRKVRRPRSKTSSKAPAKRARQAPSGASVTTVSDGSRCTPMEGGADGTSTAGNTSLPPESKLAASGERKSPTSKPKRPKARRKLNKIGRRYQLARELIEQVDWLRGCSVSRIAWVIRDVADAGWTLTEVLGWLHFRGEIRAVRRPSGFLATLLRDALSVLDTEAKRTEAVAQWRAAVEAARRDRIQQVRHRAERHDGAWDAPRSRAVQREFDEARSQMQALLGDEAGAVLCGEGDLVGLEELTEEQIIDMRVAATKDPGLIHAVIDTYDALYARQLFTHDLVEETLRLDKASSHLVITQPWAAA
ncbi:transcriptional regulator [Streptomyces sioyaensis]|uniref:transcriptional regulator n=1 Tax=Streptomyces sioyaensis TaxID=67364 RepID=UPI0033DEB5B9